MEKPIFFKDPWGFSKLDVFRLCKAKFKYQFLDKLPQPSSPALERGGVLHQAIESYLNGWSKTLPDELLEWQEAFDELKTKNFWGEQAIGIDREWNLLPDWFNKKTWLRVKMDAYIREPEEMVVIDFKSGKYRVPSTDQIELYAIAGLSIAPTTKKVTAEFWFLDTKDVYTREYSRDELIELRKKYEAESETMYTNEVWAPEPSQECRWCPYSRTKNGLCKY